MPDAPPVTIARLPARSIPATTSAAVDVASKGVLILGMISTLIGAASGCRREREVDIASRLWRPPQCGMDSWLTTIGLPVALAIVMLGLGLGLTVGDFRRVATYPKLVLVALGCQVVLLPALCFLLVLLFDLSPALAVGMMLLAASPGGTTANLFSHLFGGHVAVNVTLTAVNSVLAVFTLPIVVNLSADYFMGDSTTLGLQFDKVVQVFAIVLIPVAIGMALRARFPTLADRLAGPVKILSVVVLVAVIIGAIVNERENIADYFVAVGLVVLVSTC